MGLTSSLMMRLGRRPCSSGGMRDPRRLDVPDPGAREPFLESPVGVFSRMTSIFGASGALISGTLCLMPSSAYKPSSTITKHRPTDKKAQLLFIRKHFHYNGAQFFLSDNTPKTHHSLFHYTNMLLIRQLCTI